MILVAINEEQNDCKLQKGNFSVINYVLFLGVKNIFRKMIKY